MTNIGEPTIFQIVLQYLNENGGNENILIEIDKLIKLYPQYTNENGYFYKL